MSKAIYGAALLGGALLDGAAMFFMASSGVGLAALPFMANLMGSLVLGGVGMEAGAIAAALTNTSQTTSTMHQAAAPRQVIYGQRRVAGIPIYESTTGSHFTHINMVIVLAGHVCDSILNMYIDGRQVFWTVGSGGNVTRNGVNFGGHADGNTYTGPGGAPYNFGGMVYAEARFGDQSPGDVISGLTANDPSWAADGLGNSPWVGGCTYVYVKLDVNAGMFPNGPLQSEIKFTVNGKNDIWDPRTSTRGFTNNWALCVADKLTDTAFGLGDTSGVNQAQLIAAANVCDEAVAIGIGGTEARYTLNWMHNSDVAPGSALDTMMSAAGGRPSFIGGEWFLWPAYWQGPSFSFDENALTARLQWKPKRSARDLVNRVNGTYIAPNYPYNTAGNAYDAFGWYNGTTANNWPFEWQPTNYPQYAQDVRHGYSSDHWLTEDGGVEHPLELALPCVISVTQAQRLAKIALRRNRWQGSGAAEMNLAAWGMQPTDVMEFTCAALGWSGKVLEVVSTAYRVTQDQGAPAIRVDFEFQETDASIYEDLVAGEEQTVYDVPSNPQATPGIPAAPTGMSLTSSAATATIGADNVVHPRVWVQWTDPQDALTTLIQVQYALVVGGTPGPWLMAGNVPVGVGALFVDNVIAGQESDFQIRGLRASSGAASPWVAVNGFTVTTSLSVLSNKGIGIGSLVGEIMAGATTADILCHAFTAVIGNVSVSVLPLGATVGGLNPGQLYFVYYIDPTFAGGAVTPIATQNRADFENKVGYFLIDSIVTPVLGTTGSGGGYIPNSYSDVGTRTTQSPEAAYDGDVSTYATVSSSSRLVGGGGHITSEGILAYNFGANILTAAATLSVTAEADFPGTGSVVISAFVGGTGTILLSTTSAVGMTTYTLALLSGTDLSTVSVNIDAHSGGGFGVSTVAKLAEISIA